MKLNGRQCMRIPAIEILRQEISTTGSTGSTGSNHHRSPVFPVPPVVHLLCPNDFGLIYRSPSVCSLPLPGFLNAKWITVAWDALSWISTIFLPQASALRRGRDSA